MVILKTHREIALMGKAGKLLASCHREIAKRIRPGMTTWDIELFVEQYLHKHGATPEQKGYRGYPYATCTSVNDVICHGFPDKKRLLERGDIVKVDMVVNINGWLADSAWTHAVGDVSPKIARLLQVTKEALYIGIEKAVPGNRIGDIGHSIQTFAEAHEFSVVRQFVGHGIGRNIHEQPEVPHFGFSGMGLRLKPGMVITIEPMINTGTYEAQVEEDGWTARTVDGGWSAQYEHTVAITENGPLILTEQDL